MATNHARVIIMIANAIVNRRNIDMYHVYVYLNNQKHTYTTSCTIGNTSTVIT